MSDDGFQYFIERASRQPLLTAAEEVALAKRIEAGAAKDASEAEQVDGDRARQELIGRNVLLAVKQARRYQHAGVPLEDLVQEALIGIDRAARKFDWRKGHKFSTYAMWWIRHFIQRAVHKNRATIRIPGHIAERKRRIDQYLREHPGSELEEACEALDITLEQAEDAMSTTRVSQSLDAPYADEEAGDRYATIPDENAPDPQDIATDTHPRITAALAQLEPLQRRVIELRFGFNDEHPKSRDEVARILDVKPHAVQRAQRAALTQLGEELGSTIGLEEGAA